MKYLCYYVAVTLIFMQNLSSVFAEEDYQVSIKKALEKIEKASRTHSVDEFSVLVDAISSHYKGQHVNLAKIQSSASMCFRTQYDGESEKARDLLAKADSNLDFASLELLKFQMKVLTQRAEALPNEGNVREKLSKEYMRVVDLFHSYLKRYRYRKSTLDIYAECFQMYSSAASSVVKRTDEKADLKKLCLIHGALGEACQKFPSKAVHIHIRDTIVQGELTSIDLLQNLLDAKEPATPIGKDLKKNIRNVIIYLKKDTEFRSNKARSYFIDPNEIHLSEEEQQEELQKIFRAQRKKMIDKGKKRHP